jgi:long-chain fatty acid transport protein
MPASATAKKYALSTIEFNPTIAFALSKKISFAFGFRYLVAKGEIALDARNVYELNMKGSGKSAGYNFALSYQARDSLRVSTTYRSKISLRIKGDGDARLGANSLYSKASIAAHIPANFIAAIAYTFQTDTTLEVVYDKTFWSIITETNLEFENPILEATLGKSSEKKWHDSTVYRVGVTQQFDTLKLMTGFSYSPSAADEEYVTFASPETDFITFSLGSKYQIMKNFEIGVAALYAKGEKRVVSQPTKELGVNGTLGERDVMTLSLGFEYKF